jgi:CheY-like chemotaxis protein
MLPKIFIVDDDIDELVFYYNAFEKEDFKVDLSFFRNPEGLIPHLDGLQPNEFPNLIVSDLNMPKLTGYQLLNNLKSSNRYKNIPVIICSTSDDAANSAQCKNLGADEYIVKPFDLCGYKHVVETLAKHCPRL